MENVQQPLIQPHIPTPVVGGMGMGMKIFLFFLFCFVVGGLVLLYKKSKDVKKSMDDGGDGDCGDNQEKNDDGDCICVDGFSFDDDGTTCILDGIDIIGVWDKGKQYGGTGIKISHDDFLPYKDGGNIAKDKTVVISNGTDSATMTIADLGTDGDYQFIYFTESKFNGISVDDPTSIKLVVG